MYACTQGNGERHTPAEPATVLATDAADMVRRDPGFRVSCRSTSGRRSAENSGRAAGSSCQHCDITSAYSRGASCIAAAILVTFRDISNS